MALPDTDHVARTCKASTLDPSTKQPTPASFEFRLSNVEGWEIYLSVNWLEYLSGEANDMVAKLERLREYQLRNPSELKLIKPTRGNMYAVLPVAAVQSNGAVSNNTALECGHRPGADGDPHSGIFPHPGTHDWTNVPDDPMHLAVQQFLFESVCHKEPGIPPEGN